MLPAEPSMNMLANQSVCDQNSWISCTYFLWQILPWLPQYCTLVINQFEGFFMEILTFSCSLYMYVGLRDIKLPKHQQLWRLWHYFFYLGKTYRSSAISQDFHGYLNFFYLHEKSLEMAVYMFCSHKKITSRTFILSSFIIFFHCAFIRCSNISSMPPENAEISPVCSIKCSNISSVFHKMLKNLQCVW